MYMCSVPLFTKVVFALPRSLGQTLLREFLTAPRSSSSKFSLPNSCISAIVVASASFLRRCLAGTFVWDASREVPLVPGN